MTDNTKTPSFEINQSKTSEDRNEIDPCFYVGIGASAGGLEALQDLFQRMPADSGAAFIVVQHLSPDFKSVVEELLGRSTDMNVFNVVDGVVVKANTVYVIPPRKNMMIAEGKLLLVDQMPDGNINFPIDIFFRSLAEDQQDHSIAVVLSGTGSDGSRGIQAVKEVGGLIIVQEPETAKFDGMPNSAIKTGVADVIAASSEIAQKLLQCMTHPLVSGKGESLINYLEGNESILAEVFSLLKEHNKIDFTLYKQTTIARRLERRIGINQLSSLQEYYSLLIRSPQEIAFLAKDMLIGVTSFFRDPEIFEILKSTIIPEILDETPISEPIRVWIAGCASGEEAYSIAIIFDELIRERKEKHTVKIFATDVDKVAIAEAGSGKYPVGIKADLSEERVKTYFTLIDDCYVIDTSIRQMVIFAAHNLIRDPPFSNTHLTVCRNLLIYFQQDAQKRVLAMLHFSLLKNGFLFLGGSESLGELSAYFEVINKRCRLYKKVIAARIHTGTSVPLQPLASNDRLPSLGNLLQNYKGYDKPIPSNAVSDALINDYAPPCIVLNEQLEVLHVFGNIGSYTRKIKPGKFSSSIKDIIINDLSIALSTALHRAEQQEEDVVYNEVKLTQTDGSILSINLKVRFVKDLPLNGINFLVLFENPVEIDEGKTATVITYDANDQQQQRILDLESELHKSQEHLQVTVEELGTTNEELQSSNEELLSANEELQSTNEELQSVNEELYTVNSEYQEKIEELTQANTDLDNIIKSTTIGLIFLDEAMLIRNFTPASTKHINLLASDMGRPFHHIAHNLTYDLLLKDIANVIESAKAIENEVRTSVGGTVIVKIVPYYTEKHVPKGCVLSITDVTQVRSLEGALHASYQELRATINQSFISRPEESLTQGEESSTLGEESSTLGKVSSTQGEESSIQGRLPSTQESESSTQGAKSSNPRKELLRILIIDDNQNDRDIIAHYLDKTSTQYEVIEAGSALIAKKLLQEGSFDVCLIDYNLGTTTAFELITELPSECRNTAFILLSGVIGEVEKNKALEIGIYDAVDKSDLTPALLERCIRYTIRHKSTEMYLAQADNRVNTLKEPA